jgi:Trk K+ transport system NAD-binding subunit
VLLLSAGCDVVISESGIMAVVVAGVVVGNLRSRFDRDLREFKDQLTVLMIGLLFVLLAADVRIATVLNLGWEGLAVVGALLFVVRPLQVWLCTGGSELRTADRIFLGWIAPRGIVAAAVASVTASALSSAGIEGGSELRALVFLTIAVTVVLAGLTAAPLGTLLGVRLPGRDLVAILGAQGLGLELGRALRDADVTVVFVDSNPQSCRQAEEAGFSVVFGNALQERTMVRARMGSVGSAIGITPNQVLNSVFATRTRELFRVPQGYISVSAPGQGMAMELVEDGHARVLFDGPHDAERWDVRARRDETAVEHWRFEGTPKREESEREPAIGEHFVVLTARRGDTTTPMFQGREWRKGDVARIVVYTEEREAAHDILRARGFVPLPEPEESGSEED